MYIQFYYPKRQIYCYLGSSSEQSIDRFRQILFGKDVRSLFLYFFLCIVWLSLLSDPGCIIEITGGKILDMRDAEGTRVINEMPYGGVFVQYTNIQVKERLVFSFIRRRWVHTAAKKVIRNQSVLWDHSIMMNQGITGSIPPWMNWEAATTILKTKWYYVIQVKFIQVIVDSISCITSFQYGQEKKFGDKCP